jgi:hypothetical protein
MTTVVERRSGTWLLYIRSIRPMLLLQLSSVHNIHPHLPWRFEELVNLISYNHKLAQLLQMSV